MSDTVLAGDVTIYYLDENRQKRLEWTGSAAGTRTVNELYSALQDWFDEPGQMDDGIPMSAQTPVEYTVGTIDTGDTEPWYLSYEMVQHLTGGAIRTSGWTRTVDVAAGVITVQVTGGGAIVAGDVGLDIAGATTGNGTLLEFIDDGTYDYLVIRPNSSAAADNFSTNTQNITCNGHVAVQAQANSSTGEQIWANLYSIGTIEAKTHVYVYQGAVADDADRVRVTSIIDTATDWWSDGHIDMLLYTKNFKMAPAAAYAVIDGGYATVYARKGTTLYDSFEVSTSTTSGGRNPIPLSTAPDLDNTTGYQSITFTAVAGTWAVGDDFSGDTSGARAIITKIDSPGATQTVHYVLLGGDVPLTTFQTAAEALTNVTTAGTGTKDGNAPAAQGPALDTWFTANTFPSITYAACTADINDDGIIECYGVTIDCNQNPLTEVYEWLKYVTRQGATITTNTDGIPGESYIGAEVYLAWSGAVTGTIAEGANVTQATTLATGVIISIDETNKKMLLRNARGTFATGYIVTDNDNSGTVTIDGAAVTFGPKKASPLGTFAGGTFFGARGVRLFDWLAANENSFQLTPVEGGTKERPTAIAIEVTNLAGTGEATATDDRVAVFRLTGLAGTINKTEYSSTGNEIVGDTTLTTDVAIAQDVPGKTVGGVLRIRDASDDYQGYRLRYDSWTSGTFTLSSREDMYASAGTSASNVYVGSGFPAVVKRGDLVLNTDILVSGVAYVTSTSGTMFTMSPSFVGQAAGDIISLNVVPINMATADDIYVPLIDTYAAAATASCSIVYDSQIYFRVVVRNSAAATKILPFTTDDTTAGTDRSIATIRSTDTIIT